MQDLTNEGILLVLATEGTPIRAYTDAMLASHNAEFDVDFSVRVMLNLVSAESNVRQVVTRVALGEADAGIVLSIGCHRGCRWPSHHYSD